nr:MAG TPA: hypothetical protein [Caudoviricetes sp.]
MKLKVALIFQILIISNLLLFRRENGTRVVYKSLALHLIYNTTTDSVFIADSIRVFYLILPL